MISTQAAPPQSPADFRVLIVEDDYFIADDLVRSLKSQGMTIVGPVAKEKTAQAALDQGRVDFAVLDINLNGSVVFCVAADLRRRGIPFLFLTGYDKDIVPSEFSDVMLLQKPQGLDAIAAELNRRRRDARHLATRPADSEAVPQ